jgi:hypothetical protein
MTAKKNQKPSDGLIRKGEPDQLEVVKRDDEPLGRTLARVALDPLARHANLAGSFAHQAFGGERVSAMTETSHVLGDELVKASKGDLTMASRILAAQATSLDALFTEMARRSGSNMGQYPKAAERYMRLALKAQANCRATLDALAKLHQPREQTVKHAHVNQGAQAVVAEHFHNHQGERQNGKTDKQCQASETGTPSLSPALPGPDPLENGVPIASRKGEAALQDARWNQARCT